MTVGTPEVARVLNIVGASLVVGVVAAPAIGFATWVKIVDGRFTRIPQIGPKLRPDGSQ